MSRAADLMLDAKLRVAKEKLRAYLPFENQRQSRVCAYCRGVSEKNECPGCGATQKL